MQLVEKVNNCIKIKDLTGVDSKESKMIFATNVYLIDVSAMMMTLAVMNTYKDDYGCEYEQHFALYSNSFVCCPEDPI